MQLDDLQLAWSAHSERLNKILTINEQLLRDVTARKLRLSLTPYVLWRGIEMLFAAGVLAIAAMLLSRHSDAARYIVLLPAVIGFAGFLLVKSGLLIARATRLDASGEVADMQRRLETIKLTEFRLFKWALLGGTVLWLPIALLLFEVSTGVAALARVDLAWLVANVVFGLLALAIGQNLAKRHCERNDLKPAMRRFVDGISGRQLASIQKHLDELATLVHNDSK